MGKAMTPTLALKDVTKSFGPIEVLHGIDFELHPGEVHALIGENGAGKSTMMKILGGFLQPTSGQVLLDGAPAPFHSGPEAEARGVVVIHQEFNLAQGLTVSQNIWLGARDGRVLPGPQGDAQGDAGAAGPAGMPGRAGSQVQNACRSRTARWSRSWQALSRNARVLIMDEPSAVLTSHEVQVLFRQIDRLRAAG